MYRQFDYENALMYKQKHETKFEIRVLISIPVKPTLHLYSYLWLSGVNTQ